MQTTKIEWCDMTWNPVTGCLHGCPYCYAKNYANRFKLKKTEQSPDDPENVIEGTILGAGSMGKMLDLYSPYEDSTGRVSPYPMGFSPTFHRYRLNEPQETKKPQNVFVCSMADLFGEWVPDEWIEEVFKACKAAPQHRYLFLTKNPKRYERFINKPMPDNMWFGFSQVKNEHIGFYTHSSWKTFVSMEPLLCNLSEKAMPQGIGWVIIGAESGNRKNKVIPKREWIEALVGECRRNNIPVFLKDSLAQIWGEPLICEYPWEKG